MASGERYVKAEDNIIRKYWGAIPDWRMMMFEFTKEGYDRTLGQIQYRAKLLLKKGKLPKKARAPRNGIAVRCVETGDEFESITRATKKYARYSETPSSISRVIHGEANTAYGLHWERI